MSAKVLRERIGMQLKTTICSLVFLAIHAFVVACSGGDLPPADTNQIPRQPSTPDPGMTVVSWGANWEITVRPVFSGMALSRGIGTVTVAEWQDGPLAIDYSFPEATLDTVPQRIRDAGVGLVRPKPVSGHATVSSDVTRASRDFTPPAFWPGGDAEASGPLLWISRTVLEELQSTRKSTIHFAPLPKGLAMTGDRVKNVETVTLTVRATKNVALQVNGKPIRVPALVLDDDMGGSYTLLNTADNPLVIEFRFGKDTVVEGRKLTAAPGGGYEVVGLRYVGDATTSPKRPSP